MSKTFERNKIIKKITLPTIQDVEAKPKKIEKSQKTTKKTVSKNKVKSLVTPQRKQLEKLNEEFKNIDKSDFEYVEIKRKFFETPPKDSSPLVIVQKSSQEALGLIYPEIKQQYDDYLNTVIGIIEPMSFEDFVEHAKHEIPTDRRVPENLFE